MQEKVVITARRKHVRIIFLEESAKRRRIHNFWDKRKKWIGTNLIHTLLISLTVSHKMMILLYLSVHKMLQDLKSKKNALTFLPDYLALEEKWLYHKAEEERHRVTLGSQSLKYASLSISAWDNALRGETLIWNEKCILH